MPRSHQKNDEWVVEPMHTPQEDWHISEVVVADGKGNRWIVDARQILSNYPHPKDLSGVWFSGERGVV